VSTKLLVLCGTVLLSAAIPHTSSAQVFVGGNVDWSHYTYPGNFGLGSETEDIFSFGGYYLSPGLRLGYLFAGGALVASADAGVQVEHGEAIGEYTNFIVEPALAYAFSSDHPTSPYVGVAAGWHHLNFGQALGGAFTRPLVGGFLGVRHRVSAGHGMIRAEFRYDHFTEQNTSFFVLPKDMVGVRLGFDLLLGH